MPKLPATPERTTITRIVLHAVGAVSAESSPQGRALGVLAIGLGLAARYPNDALRLYDRLVEDLASIGPEGPAHLGTLIDDIHEWLHDGD